MTTVPVDEHGFYSGAVDPARCAECAGAPAAGPCALHRDVSDREWLRARRRFLAAAVVDGLREWYRLVAGPSTPPGR